MVAQIAEIPYTSKQLADKFAARNPVYFAGETSDNPRFPPKLLRIHRAIRWLGRAEKEEGDPDAAFIFHWIAFNAAYARDMPRDERVGEASEFLTFIEKVVSVDKERIIENYVILKTSPTIAELVNNQYVFGEFWRYKNGDDKAANWEDKLSRDVWRLSSQFARGDTVGILRTLFDRLYVLRNQLVHGGATWNSSMNRSQVEDGARIMAFLVPTFINLMIDNDSIFNAPPYYSAS